MVLRFICFYILLTVVNWNNLISPSPQTYLLITFISKYTTCLKIINALFSKTRTNLNVSDTQIYRIFKSRIYFCTYVCDIRWRRWHQHKKQQVVTAWLKKSFIDQIQLKELLARTVLLYITNALQYFLYSIILTFTSKDFYMFIYFARLLKLIIVNHSTKYST